MPDELSSDNDLPSRIIVDVYNVIIDNAENVTTKSR